MGFISLQEVVKCTVAMPLKEFKASIDHQFDVQNSSRRKMLADELLKQLPGLDNRDKHAYVCEVYDQLNYFDNQKK